MGFMDAFFRKRSSGNMAKDRLKFVLVSDRANCSPETMEMIKNDIIEVISKYMEIDTQGLIFRLLRRNRKVAMEMFRHFTRIVPLKRSGSIDKSGGLHVKTEIPV